LFAITADSDSYAWVADGLPLEGNYSDSNNTRGCLSRTTTADRGPWDTRQRTSHLSCAFPIPATRHV